MNSRLSNHKKRFLMVILVLPMLFVTGVSVLNNNTLQNASAQANSTTDTFNATGYTGQIFVLPQGMQQRSESIEQFGLGPPVGSVIAGNWSFAVNGGQLQDFKWNAEAITLSGKVNGTLSITGISNPIGAVPSSTNNTILLAGNQTALHGNADININGRTSFYDVPVSLYMINGKLVNLSLDPSRTGGFFSVPLFGVVTSLTR